MFIGERSVSFQHSSVIHRQQIDIKIKECIFRNSTDNVSDHRALDYNGTYFNAVKVK